MREQSSAATHFFARHFTERFAVAPDRAEQDDEVLHAARKHRAREQPQRAGKISELRSERRADERAGTCNRGEVVTEQYPFVCGDEVAAIVVTLGGSRAGVIEREQLRGNECGVESIGDEIDADSGEHEPDCAERFAALERDFGDSRRAEQRHQNPHEHFERFIHVPRSCCASSTPTFTA